MRQSKLFTKTRKEAPKDEVSKNAELLIRAGFIHKEMAGVYSFLPLGLRVIEKLKSVIREEMNSSNGQEILMSTLQRKELWEVTNRWGDETVDVWFKSALNSGGEVGFGWSHEEPITYMMKDHIASFRDLPIFVYQFQNKLRNELRAKSGVMRGREFIMKDMYSFSRDQKEHDEYYNGMIEAYNKVFSRIGLGEDTFLTFAPGGAFTEFSHEFQTVIDNGEDTIYINKEKNIAINDEVLNEDTLSNFNVTRDDLREVKTTEVGNIFNFGTQKCKELNLFYNDKEGNKVPVWLGSYGIGVTRLMGVIAEKLSDEKGIVWPSSVAPFDIHLVEISNGDEEVKKSADELYSTLSKNGVEVLYDDRSTSAGQKFADSDLIGIPVRVVVSKKTLAEGKFERVERKSGATDMVDESTLLSQT